MTLYVPFTGPCKQSLLLLKKVLGKEKDTCDVCIENVESRNGPERVWWTKNQHIHIFFFVKKTKTQKTKNQKKENKYNT